MSTNDTQPSLSRGRQRLFAAVSLILGTGLALMFAEWGLDIYFQRLQSQSMDPGLIRYHSQLGWSLSPGWTGQHSHHDYQATYTIGPDGFRNQTANALDADAKQFAVFGDSFTFGLGVEDDQTFISLLNATGAGSFRNLATPGTSTDQQLLLMRQVLPDDSLDGVLLVVYLPNDLLDNTLAYPLQAEQAKPYFRLSGGELVLANSPVPLVPKPALLRSTTLSSLVLEGFPVEEDSFGGSSIGRLVSTAVSSRQYALAELRPVLERNLAPAVEIFEALIDEVGRQTRLSGLSLQVALLPGRDAMVNTGGISHHYQEYLRQTLLQIFDRNGIEAVDLMSQIAAEPGDRIRQMYFPNDGHLTPAGHSYVADILTRQLD